jgi:hypothetical protein
VKVIADPRFTRWYQHLPPETRAAVAVMLGYLSATRAGDLGRPRAAQITNSRHFPKMWELRRAGRTNERIVVLRVLVAIHTDEVAVALIGGDKTGNWTEWYDMAIATADSHYDDFLRRHR